MIKIIKFIALPALAIAVATTMSCKKVLNHPDDGGNTDNNSNNGLTTILDSVYLYAHQLYFWNEKIPSYAQFNPSQYNVSSNSDSINLMNELFAFTVTYNSAINSVTGRSYEFYAADSSDPGDYAGPKYSYFEDSATYGGISAIANSSDYLGGTDYGFGFYPGIWSDNTLLVRYVENGSPFDKNGIQRGDRILSINGTDMNFSGAANTAKKVVNAVLNSSNTSSASFKIQQIRNGVTDTLNLQLSPAYFTYNPIFKDTVVTASNGEKVGYIAYQSFTIWDGSSSTALQSAFDTFADSSITDLVIDLRYNGGGYVETSQNFANLVAPTSANGKTMYTEYYNDTMTSGKAMLLAKQGYSVSANEWSAAKNTYKFSKIGSVGSLTRVIFLVSDNTASAAELLINNLKPYLNVVLIGSQWEEGSGDHTYGKPVGFFPISVGKYVYYFPEFASGNATDPTGGATYYNGMSVNNASTDDARYYFGNPKETAFAQALYYIANGNYSTNYNAGYLSNLRTIKTFNLQKAFKQPSGFNGMIHNSIKKKS